MILRYEDIKPVCNTDMEQMPKNIFEIVTGQLEGYGYSLGLYEGKLVKLDDCYAPQFTDAEYITIYDAIYDAIEYREDLLDEKYGDADSWDNADASVNEYYAMTNYLEQIKGA